MLHVHYGDMPNVIYNTAVYFRNVYLDAWFDDPYAQRMIKAVDKAEVLGSHLIKSRQLGLIPPTDLSGGVKTLLLIHNIPNKVFNASTCGDNCAHWLLDMGKKREVTINLYHMMDFGKRPFELEILNNHQIVHTMPELILAAGEFLDGDA